MMLALLAAALIAAIAYRLRALSRSGAAAATITGGFVFGLGGLPWAALLLVFFISSSALSKLFSQRKAALNEKYAKDSRRDWAQVAANGGLGALLALAQWLWPAAWWPWAAYVGGMAAVNADTWATELGALNPTPPRRLTTFQPVEPGTSGAVSLFGSLAALAAAALIGVVAALFTPRLGGATSAAHLVPAGVTVLAASLGGLAGSFFDSLLGATIQAIYWCPLCAKETEQHPRHRCGTPTTLRRGWLWLNNDWVNFVAGIVGALVCAAIFAAFGAY